MHDVREIKQYGMQNHDYTDNKSTMEEHTLLLLKIVFNSKKEKNWNTLDYGGYAHFLTV